MAGQGDADHERVLQQSCLVPPLANRLLPTATMGNVAAGAAGSWCLASPALVAKLPNLPHASLGGISHGQRSCSQLCLLCMRAEGDAGDSACLEAEQTGSQPSPPALSWAADDIDTFGRVMGRKRS